MKKSGLQIKIRAGTLLLALVLCSASAFGLSYTATATGNWGSGATWLGGTAPGYNVTTDAVVIPLGITVTMDNNVSISGAQASVDVAGNLSSNSGITLTVEKLGKLSGTGVIALGGLNLKSGADMPFTGTANIENVMNTATGLQVAGAIHVSQMLILPVGGLIIIPGGSLGMGWGSTINISGGTLSVNGGLLNLTPGYNVSYFYSGSNISTGAELSGSGLGNLTVDVASGNSVILTSDLIVNGSMSLSSGSLKMGASNLTINGHITAGGNGTLASGSHSNVTLNSSGGTGGVLKFAAGSSLGILNVNVGSGNQAMINGNVDVKEILAVNSGTLNFSNGSLTISGALSGNGDLFANSESNLTVNTSGGLVLPLRFADAGQALSNLTVNVGEGHNVTLGSNMAVSGTLYFQSGNFTIDGHDFILTGPVMGEGTMSSTAASDIAINTWGGTGGKINFANNSTVTNFIINVLDGKEQAINGTLTVNGTLQLTTGTLNFSGASIILNGILGGTGTLGGSKSANFTVNTPGGLAGHLNFIAGEQMVNNLTISTGVDSSAILGTNLTVFGTLNIWPGNKLTITGDALTLSGDLKGTGSLVVDPLSTILVNAAGGLTAPIKVSGLVGTFAVDVNRDKSVTLGSDLSVAKLINLQSGSLVLAGYNLAITGDIADGGTGNISSTGASNITISTVLNPAGALAFADNANIVGNLSVSTGGNLNVASNIRLSDVLALNGGTINIGNDTLSIISGGSIYGGNASAYIIASGEGALGMLLSEGDTRWLKFPIGTGTNFAPVILQLNSGSSGGMLYASVHNGVYAHGTSGAHLSSTIPLVDLTWMIEPSFGENANVNLITMWPGAAELNSFNRDSAYISHYTGSEWDVNAAQTAIAHAGGMFSLYRTRITSFSPFAVFGAGAFATGISELSGAANFEMYPNPALDNVTVKSIQGSTNNLSIDIIDMTGQIVARYKLTDYITNLSLLGLAPGNYFVKLYGDNTSVIKTLTKL